MIHPRRSNREELVYQLEAMGAVFTKGNECHCFAKENHQHGDKKSSAGIYLEDGVWRFKCLGGTCGVGGDVFDMEAIRLGVPVEEVLKRYPLTEKQRREKPMETKKLDMVHANLKAFYDSLARRFKGGHLEKLHEYLTEDRQHHQYILRWRKEDGNKEIRPGVRQADGKTIAEKFPDQRILYRLPDILEQEQVVVVEGELKADFLWHYGIPATCSSGGEKSVDKTPWGPLAGKKVVLWPDKGVAGTNYVGKANQRLQELQPICLVSMVDIEPLDLQDGQDVVDVVKRMRDNGTDEEVIGKTLRDIIAAAKGSGCADELHRYITRIAAGEMSEVSTGFSILDTLLQILPDSLTMVVGNPGASKSLLMLQMATFWLTSQVRVALYELEKDDKFHLLRVLAQRHRMSGITNRKWVRENPIVADDAMQHHKDFVNEFGRILTTAPDIRIDQNHIIQWVEQKAQNGNRCIIVDPITIAERNDDKEYRADGGLMQEMRRIARKYCTAIFMVIHPTKLVQGLPEMANISGGASYSRFSDNILWLENHDEKVSKTHFHGHTDDCEHNRTLWILKTRDGSGTGLRLAMCFDGDNLLLKEVGLIVKKKSAY